MSDYPYKFRKDVPLKPCGNCGKPIPFNFKCNVTIRRYIEEIKYCSVKCGSRGTAKKRGELIKAAKDAKKQEEAERRSRSLLRTASVKI